MGQSFLCGYKEESGGNYYYAIYGKLLFKINHSSIVAVYSSKALGHDIRIIIHVVSRHTPMRLQKNNNSCSSDIMYYRLLFTDLKGVATQLMVI